MHFAIRGVILIVFIWQLYVKHSLTICKHKPIPMEQLVTGIQTNFLRQKIGSSIPQAIRIHFEYMSSFTSYENSEQIKREIFMPAKARLESMILVKSPSTQPITVPRQCIEYRKKYRLDGLSGCTLGCSSKTMCLSYELPEYMLQCCKSFSNNGDVIYSGPSGSGVPNSDIVLLVNADNCKGATVAFSASCFLESELDRPILGVLTICKGYISAGKNILGSISTIQHEVIHALGFSLDKFAFFRYQNGTPIVKRNTYNLPSLGFNRTMRVYHWNDYIAKEFVRGRSNIHETYTKRLFGLTLPTVLNEARKHFNCSTLDGVDLEDYPIVSHFNEYILFNELMTPYTNHAMDKISRLTLAFLKDTGWYDVNMAKVEDFSYSINTGCGPIYDGCYKYMNDQKSKGLPLLPYCDTIFTPGNVFKCRDNRKYFYFCFLFKQNIPPKYQYFNELRGVPDWEASKYGGFSIITEYCPTYMILTKPSSVCSDTSNIGLRNKMNVLDSYYGNDSLCFENSVVRSTPPIRYGASCQKYAVDKIKKSLTVFFKNITVQCPSNETHFIPGINGYTATFNCPNLDEFMVKGSTMMAMDRIYKLFCFTIVIWNIRNIF